MDLRDQFAQYANEEKSKESPQIAVLTAQKVTKRLMLRHLSNAQQKFNPTLKELCETAAGVALYQRLVGSGKVPKTGRNGTRWGII
jgi:hypothetical protein